MADTLSVTQSIGCAVRARRRPADPLRSLEVGRGEDSGIDAKGSTFPAAVAGACKVPNKVVSSALDDNGNTGTGGPLTGTDTAIINVTAVNDAPSLLLTISPSLVGYTDNAGPTSLLTGGTVFDPDLPANFSGDRIGAMPMSLDRRCASRGPGPDDLQRARSPSWNRA